MPSKPSTGPDTALARNEEPRRLRWSGKVPLAWRILAVNIFVIALLVGGFLYLDSYRSRLIDERQERLTLEAQLLNSALRTTPAQGHPAMIREFSRIAAARIRVYDADGDLVIDSFRIGPPAYRLRDPDTQPINRQIARAMDRFLDWVVRAPTPAEYVEPELDTARAWPELRAAIGAPGTVMKRYRFAPDRTPMISTAISDANGRSLLLLTNARDITRTVRAERLQLGFILAAVTILSVLLSLFLARTIVLPLKRLADAATRVRLGRARDVVVPRLPSRRDEIGTLARALSDMTLALRARIDAGEHFAADVTHELKNPLASLRSAIEGLERVEQPDLRAQLFAIAHDDVRRLDRLISDISEASRVDAELSRSQFERIDVGALIEPIIAARRARAKAGDPGIAFARPRVGTAMIMGEPSRLARVIENLLDNAHSFSPPGGVVRIGATCADTVVIIRIEDDGPGVLPDQREVIFRRFHSVRPLSEDFGKHSGLGLAIARTIIEAHDGEIMALDRPDAAAGACFEIRLPAAPELPAQP
ncbi:HAMP domain-containing protein [Sphingomonas lacunae]|uniref:histidine kinase n=1 Tax=Sphingomonas lacunae TaxID=2698828 RepID=A0A6M4AU86_9SPHN|nr:stimulus-sensing domain-containing protein [Sphingomonas lacunae]QJQ32655.1 HAMP domain-containing protein [Sphingomonas lacunae]